MGEETRGEDEAYVELKRHDQDASAKAFAWLKKVLILLKRLVYLSVGQDDLQVYREPTILTRVDAVILLFVDTFSNDINYYHSS